MPMPPTPCEYITKPSSFNLDHLGLDVSSHSLPYQFSTPVSCNSNFTQEKESNHEKQNAQQSTTGHHPKGCGRRRTRNVHFMMATAGKISSTSSEDSPINLVDLDKSMDIATSS